MTVVKILSVILGVIVFSLIGAWYFFLYAPSPESQCAHVIEVMKKEVRLVPPGFERECIAGRTKGKYEGLIPYAKRSKCVAQIKTLKEIEACENLK